MYSEYDTDFESMEYTSSEDMMKEGMKRIIETQQARWDDAIKKANKDNK